MDDLLLAWTIALVFISGWLIGYLFGVRKGHARMMKLLDDLQCELEDKEG